MKRGDRDLRTEKRLETLAIDTEKKKRAIVEQLRKTPVVQLACERLDVGRSTYYKWRAEDHIFARAADQAKEAGRFLVNDIAESRLLSLIQNDNLTAIIFWLKHNHPKYSVLGRLIDEYDTVRDRLSVEEQTIAMETMARMIAIRNSAKNVASKLSNEEMVELSEEEEREVEERGKMEELYGS